MRPCVRVQVDSTAGQAERRWLFGVGVRFSVPAYLLWLTLDGAEGRSGSGERLCEAAGDPAVCCRHRISSVASGSFVIIFVVVVVLSPSRATGILQKPLPETHLFLRS